MHETRPARDRAYLVAVQSPGQLLRAEDSLVELGELARTAGAEVVGSTVQRLQHPNVATYVGKGKLESIAENSRDTGANVVLFDDELSPSQQRNLEKALDLKVIDRTALILDIFAQRARTKEGRLQVELAQSQYLLPRLRGQWQHLERMEGAIGLRGPGETQIETDRRLIRRRISKLKQDLDKVRSQRSQYRQNRKRSGARIAALVGYTNAGKSTLMQALTRAEDIAANKLFATLDPLTRQVRLPSGDNILLTDTVGFIQKLPTELVAAFRATLEELEEADVLLHVVDISHPRALEQAQTVDATLETLGVADKPRITVLNKIDQLEDPDGTRVTSLAEAKDLLGVTDEAPPGIVHVSAAKRWGLDELLEALQRELVPGYAESPVYEVV
jgi:GTP-binding protein HflX